RYLRGVAAHFVRDRLRKLRRAEAREARAVRRLGGRPPGPTEAQVHAAREELEGRLAEPIRQRLRVILKESRPTAVVSGRTLRRWSRELDHLCTDLLLHR